MKTRIHINQHVIKQNRKSNSKEPVITAKSYKENKYGNTVSILDDNGKVVAQIVYRPDQPLSCGAVCWVETLNEVKVE